MAYSKQTWSSNELITADKLNHIEDGIPTKTSQLSNDSGFLTSHQSIAGKKNTQSAVSSPSASGTAVAFIDTISQNAQGVISPTKKSIPEASTSAAGLMSSSDKTKLNGIVSGANVGTVTSVATGVGLTGGTITGSGTLKAKLRSETALTIDSAAATTTSGKVYPVAVDKSGYLAVNVPWTDNNTTYSAGTGLSLSGTTFSNSGVTGVKGNSESSYRTGNVNLTAANIGAIPSNAILTPAAPFPIPAIGATVDYNMSGITSGHELLRWNFSASGEDVPPGELTWYTYDAGYFKITNLGCITSESIRPIFVLPNAATVTVRS